MKIDKSKLDAMSALSDEELWKKIREIAGEKGIKMPENAPSSAELSKVRSALSEADKLNLPKAMRIVNNLKRGSEK